MHKILTFPDHLRLINERSTAFRAAVAAAPSLDLQVPTHPERTLFDLVQHVGMGRRKSAAIVAAGPADAPPDKSAWDDGMGAPREREALLAWWTESVEQLTSALREAGPDRGCWTWWGDCARHRKPLVPGRGDRSPRSRCTPTTPSSPWGPRSRCRRRSPSTVSTTASSPWCATTVAWPHEPAVVDYHATEGHSWRLRLSGDGARVARLTPAAGEDPDTADVSARGTASDLVLFFYGRIPLDSLKWDGDRRIFDQLIAWDPSV